MEELFRAKLKNIINMRHELVRLGELIDWERESKTRGVSGTPVNPAAERGECPSESESAISDSSPPFRSHIFLFAKMNLASHGRKPSSSGMERSVKFG
ncbi:MAG TPA: hypothetical protein VII25_03550 [Candidatus Acidoferrum sp.]